MAGMDGRMDGGHKDWMKEGEAGEFIKKRGKRKGGECGGANSLARGATIIRLQPSLA